MQTASRAVYPPLLSPRAVALAQSASLHPSPNDHTRPAKSSTRSTTRPPWRSSTAALPPRRSKSHPTTPSTAPTKTPTFPHSPAAPQTALARPVSALEAHAARANATASPALVTASSLTAVVRAADTQMTHPNAPPRTSTCTRRRPPVARVSSSAPKHLLLCPPPLDSHLSCSFLRHLVRQEKHNQPSSFFPVNIMITTLSFSFLFITVATSLL